MSLQKVVRWGSAAAILLSVLVATPALAANYYVSPSGSDSNAGTQAAPWKTINYADTRVIAGDTVHLLPGTYTGCITTHANGTASAPITYISDTRYSAKIDGLGQCSDAIWNENGNYERIYGIDMTGNYQNTGSVANGGSLGVAMQGASTEVGYSQFHDFKPNFVAAVDTVGGYYGNGGMLIHDNIFRDLHVNVTSNEGGYGVYLAAPNARAYNNLFYRIDTLGLQMWHGTNGDMAQNNTFIGIGNVSNGAAMLIGEGDGGAMMNSLLTAENNIIINSARGIVVDEGGGTGSISRSSVFRNNLFYNNNQDWEFVSSIYGTDTTSPSTAGYTVTGTVNLNPQFVSATTDNYHLQSTSPAIDKAYANGIASDFDGTSRPQGAGYDIGAYEYVSAPTSGTNYYVNPSTGSDANAGTQTAPWRTINYADAHIRAGDTVHLMPGTYTGCVITSTNGTAAAPITYISDTTRGAKLDGQGQCSSIWEERGDYVRVYGIDMTGNMVSSASSVSSGGGVGFIVEGGYSEIAYSTFHDFQAYFVAAVDLAGDYYGKTNESAHHNTFYNLHGSSGGYGIYLATPNSEATNNLIYNTDSIGIHAWHGSTGGKILNNTITNLGGTGIYAGEGDSGGRLNTTFTIENNIVTNSYRGLVITGSSPGSIDVVDTVIKNNLLYNNSVNNTEYSQGSVDTTDLASAGFNISGTINADPKFVTPGSDFHLQSTSPAVNTGINDGVTADLDGTPRPQGSAYDIGAYEYGTAALPTKVRIEVGGTASYTDTSGNVWAADTGFTGGSTVDRGSIAIANTTDPRLYQTERFGMTGYSIPVANGSYTVKLHFAETSGGVTASGMRVFNVSLQGVAVLSNFDVFAQAGGANRALVKTFTTTVTNGVLSIGFTAVQASPEINGIEIIPAADTQPPSTPTNLTATAASQSQINLSWTASTDNTAVTGYKIYRNGTQVALTAGTSYSDIGLTAATTYTYTVAAYDAAGNTSTQSTAVSATTQGTVAQPTRIEVGNTTSYTDTLGNVWAADMGASGGTTIDRGAITIANTTDPRIYQTERYGMTGYSSQKHQAALPQAACVSLTSPCREYRHSLTSTSLLKLVVPIAHWSRPLPHRLPTARSPLASPL
jgi:hypothetical protein